MGLIKEFREFAVKGNAIDLAVGVIIGAAFGKIVTSLVNDIIMPPIGLITKSDFTNNFTVLKAGEEGVTEFATLEAAQSAGAVTLNWGNFIQVAVDFLIIAFCIFMMVRAINKMKAKEEEKPAAKPAEDIVLLREIRDSLKK